MKLFLLNILLALLWVAVSGTFTPEGLLAGFVVGFIVLLLARPVFGPRPYYRQFFLAIGFVFFFIGELVLSSLRVAKDVLAPELKVIPGVVAYPLEVRTDPAITILACLISLTPGTLSLDVSDDKSTLYVHSMYDGNDLDTVRAGLRRLEVRVKALMEPEWGPPPVRPAPAAG